MSKRRPVGRALILWSRLVNSSQALFISAAAARAHSKFATHLRLAQEEFARERFRPDQSRVVRALLLARGAARLERFVYLRGINVESDFGRELSELWPIRERASRLTEEAA